MKSDLQRIVDDASPEVRARIAAMASAAARERSTGSRFRPALIPLGGAAALAVVVVAVQMLRAPSGVVEKAPPMSADDVALLLNVDNLDLLEQMEFYLWLEREPGVLDAAGANAPELPRRS